MIVAEPWYDYLAFPIAPLVVLVQVGMFFLPWRSLRLAASAACFGAIKLMTDYLGNRPPEQGEGVSFGFVIVGWYVLSMVLLVAAAIREVVQFLDSRRS